MDEPILRARIQPANFRPTPRKHCILTLIVLVGLCRMATAQVPRADEIREQHNRVLEQQREQRRLQQERWEAGRARMLRGSTTLQQQQQQAMAAAQRARAEALLRERQEVTNRVYSHFPLPLSPQNRIVDGKVYSTNQWVDVVTHATNNGSYLKVSSVKEDFVVCDVFEGVTDDSTDAPRETVKSVVVRHHPTHSSLKPGQRFKSCMAMRVEDWQVGDRSLEAYDCGLADTVENRERAGIPIPTREQVAAAQEEIAAGLAELAEKQLAARKRAAEVVEAKRQAADAKALKWNQEQADTGDAYGLYRMGERYRDGQGVPKDLSKAREYFDKAVAAGSPSAADALSRLSQVSTNPPAAQ